MDDALHRALDRLSDTQKLAANWGEGPALILAGPGSGKTTVLTSRIAKLVADSEGKRFRLLALTFTTKAAKEMRDRVDLLVPGHDERAFIGTFHSFATNLVRQHGSHLGISPDFAIFDQAADRRAVLSEALSKAAREDAVVSSDDAKWLDTIDQLRARLVVPDIAAKQFRNPEVGAVVARTYRIYEDALRESNATDFNGLILDACRLLRDVSGVAPRIRTAYKYWLVDEFQDTSPAQYRMLQLAAGEQFKDVFVVADDDQIIYQWAGASYRQLQKFRGDFEPTVIQLTENRRCPPDIVEAANRLVARNVHRTPGKDRLVASKPPTQDSIQLREFDTDDEEALEIAKDIVSNLNGKRWSTAVLGRTRALLAPVQSALKQLGVKCAIVQRRDRFISPEFNWLYACLEQVLRPNDVRMFKLLVESGNRLTGLTLDPEILLAEATASGAGYLEHWAHQVTPSNHPVAAKLREAALALTASRSAWRQIVRDVLPSLSGPIADGTGITDAQDDRAAWEACAKEIRSEKGGELELDELLQGLALRSKEPPRDDDTVVLSTVHSSKGLEFDCVYLIGLAESVMPSWQSIGKGDLSAEMEEERRNCFVAITRTRERLVLSHAKHYGGRRRQPSRFLDEMGLQAS